MDAIPSGQSGCGSTFVIDQRNKQRPTNYTGSNSCDIGAVERQSAEFTTDHVALNEAQSYGGLDVTLTDNGVYRSALGNVTVNRSNATPNGVLNATPLPLQVTLTEPIGSGRQTHNIDYDLTICYSDWELGQVPSANEAAIELIKKVGQAWQAVEPTVRDAANNCVRIDGLTTLDTWGLAVGSSPTAVRVSGQQSALSSQLWLNVSVALLTIGSCFWYRRMST